MVYKAKKKLMKISNREFAGDIKKFITSSHTFYETRVPELKVLAKRLHEEYSLRDFYRVFNKFWKSGFKGRTLAIYALQLYKDEFDLETWKVIKIKLGEIKSWDRADSIALNIIGEILIKHREIESEVTKMASSKSPWFRRMAIISTIKLVKNNEFRLAINLITEHLYDKSENIQSAVGWVLKEIGEQNPNLAKKIILKNKNMPMTVFFHATENLKELRELRELKTPMYDKVVGKFKFWKDG